MKMVTVMEHMYVLLHLCELWMNVVLNFFIGKFLWQFEVEMKEKELDMKIE
jgi:hypothetical protein